MPRTRTQGKGPVVRCGMCLGEPRLFRRTAWHILAMVDWILSPLERRRPPVSSDVSPVFVVGCSHSGTSIMTAVINNHPRIMSLNVETKILCRYHTLRTHRAWLRTSLDHASAEGKARICEKTPNHLFFLDRLFAFYPKARVVIMQRDGRDVALSMCARWAAYRAGPGARGRYFERAIKKWVAAIEVGTSYAADDRVMTVVYERFVVEPDAVMTEVCEFIGEAPVSSMLDDRPYWTSNYDGPPPDEPVSPTSHHQYRAWQVNQPIFDGRGRWKTELTAEQSAVVSDIAGEVLRELGYATE